MAPLWFKLSTHLLERAAERGITEEMITGILSNPEQIIDDETGEPGQKVHQSIAQFSGNSIYAVRVLVDTNMQPNVVKTVYKTSKIRKYHEN